MICRATIDRLERQISLDVEESGVLVRSGIPRYLPNPRPVLMSFFLLPFFLPFILI